MSARSLSLSFASIALGAVALGCTQPVSDSRESTGESADRLGSSFPPPTLVLPAVYDAYVEGGNCTNVGEWSGQATFPANTGFCTFVWNGGGLARYGDLETALVSRGGLAHEIFADSTCAFGVCSRPSIPAVRYRRDDGAGSVACYRCIRAKASMGVLYVVLPPQFVTTAASELTVVLDGQAFNIYQPGNAAAFSGAIADVNHRKLTMAAGVIKPLPE